MVIINNKKMSPSDSHLRHEALNPTASFIVQAPAGSGKTETLTQRYLNLLGHAERPEEILALTFTNKAANEMHQRIYDALLMARTGIPPASSHKHKTFALAKQVLINSEAKNWDLLSNPTRLRITTIDAFCQMLRRQLMFETKDAMHGEPTEDPMVLYHKAIDVLIADTDEKSPWFDALTQLLPHLDNNLEKLQSLIAEMLSKREQWLPILFELQLFDVNNKTNKIEIEHGFQAIIESLMTSLYRVLRLESHYRPLSTILNFANPQLKGQCQLEPDPKNLSSYLALIKLLFTKNQFRQRFSARDGLPATDKDAKKYIAWLKNYIQIFDEAACSEIAEIVASLTVFEVMAFTEDQWEILVSIAIVAKHAVQYLKLIFSQNNKVDFNEVSLQALSALGTPDNPTDLALYLDYKIKHILIDEFQDTSILQYKLLQLLTAEWQPNDGKTLFIVGDPMQSIYRFRQAEVSLFLKVRDNGIGNLKPKFLRFNCNFRSDKSIVDWVNQCFKKIFPKNDDINFGAMAYLPSTAESQSHSEAAIDCCYFQDSHEEAKAITDEIKAYQQQNPTSTIAILVRSRSHLSIIIEMLKSQNIAVNAEQIDALFHQAQIQDLLALICVLSNTENIYYWMSLLQSELFGFTLKELHQIQHLPQAYFIDRLASYLEKNQTAAHQKKLLRWLSWLQSERFHCNRSPLLRRLRVAWGNLDGFAIHQNRQIFNEFTALLKKHLNVDKTHVAEMTLFIEALEKSYANLSCESSVTVMTIHKAKGLEFDFVILPELHRVNKNNADNLFLYEQYQLADNHNHLLLSPIKHSWDKTTPSLYRAIQMVEKKRQHYELQRLLYVAVTRAKSKLYLSACPKVNAQGDIAAPEQSFLGLLWPLNQNWRERKPLSPSINDAEVNSIWPRVKQITNFTLPVLESHDANKGVNDKCDGINQPLINDILINQDQLIGSVCHRVFEYVIKNNGKYDNLNVFLNYLFHHYGVSQSLQAYIEKCATDAIENTLAKFPWLFQSKNSRCEQAMVVLSQGELQTRTPDLIIYREAKYEIVDYKFISPASGQSLERFFAENTKRYQQQLQHYQKLLALAEGIDFENIKTYLYFPLIAELRCLSRTDLA